MNFADIRPLQDRVLVRAINQAFTTADLRPRSNGSIILIRKDSTLVDGVEGDYRRMPLCGEVLAVGPGKYDKKNRFHPTTVKPGEIVIFTDWNDWEQAPPGVHMITEGDIWGYPNAKSKVS
jgi:co-chaperonin GroES (HSP10)